VVLITDKFVFVHFPKTGGMFVDGALKEALVPSRFWRKVHSVRSRLGFTVPGVKYKYYSGSRHAPCSRIPDWATDLPIVGTIRSPYDWYVSDYRFGLWKQPRSLGHWWDPRTESELQTELPTWPDISFNQFVYAANRLTSRVRGFSEYPLARTVGLMTKEFLRCFCRDRSAVYDGNEEELLVRVKQHLYPTTFLRQCRLNHDLSEFLGFLGYPGSILNQIQERDRIYPGQATRPPGESWASYYDSDLKEFIRNRERVIFSLFPELDV
jgi:hypothetical protein